MVAANTCGFLLLGILIIHLGGLEASFASPQRGGNVVSTASETYIQSTATLFQFAGQPPLANWTVLPTIGRICSAASAPPSASHEKHPRSTFTLLARGPLESSKWELLQLDVVAPSKKPNASRTPFHVRPLSIAGLTHMLSPSWKVGYAKDNALFLVGPVGLYRCKSSDGSDCAYVSAPSSTGMGDIRDLDAGSDGELWIAASDGLFHYAHSVGLSRVNVSGDEEAQSFTSVSYHMASGAVAAGTDALLWRFDGVSTWRFYRVPGIIDGPISSLAFESNGTLWIGNDVCVNRMHPNGTLERVAGLSIRGNQGGLPMANITKIAMSPVHPGVVWFGALQGAAQYHPRWLDDPIERVSRPSDWRYFYGPRWMPISPKAFSLRSEDNAVVSLAVGALTSAVDEDEGTQGAGGGKEYVPLEEVALVVTPVGVSAVWRQRWTLQEKSEYFQAMMSPRHNRFGLVGDCRLKEFGALDTWMPEANDNNGLWTSIYLASQAFRYSVTRDSKVKSEAWHYFQGMQLLNNVTGIKGLMARSVLHQSAVPPPSQGAWHASTSMPGWVWKGDTSSDEVTGHLFVYPLVYDLLAETKEEKALPRALIYDITRYIVENGYLLIDVTGRPTTWGRWSPAYLNNNQSWYDERGLNSMQMLAYLLSAYRITGDELFINSFQSLVDEYQYGENVINAKITQTSDDNYSDDELLFLPYFTYLWTGMASLQRDFELSITREWRIVKAEKASLWNFIAGVSGMEDVDLEGAIWNLRNWPLSWINWPVYNSARLDLIEDPNAKRNGQHGQSIQLIPYDEQDFFRWNSNMFNMDGGNGYDETDMGAWLLPYWMARYYGYIKG